MNAIADTKAVSVSASAAHLVQQDDMLVTLGFLRSVDHTTCKSLCSS